MFLTYISNVGVECIRKIPTYGTIIRFVFILSEMKLFHIHGVPNFYNSDFSSIHAQNSTWRGGGGGHRTI